ncbi:hypothetical protein ACA910_002012 [Epithemia clementina (nom. ined.)]
MGDADPPPNNGHGATLNSDRDAAVPHNTDNQDNGSDADDEDYQTNDDYDDEKYEQESTDDAMNESSDDDIHDHGVKLEYSDTPVGPRDLFSP